MSRISLGYIDRYQGRYRRFLPFHLPVPEANDIQMDSGLLDGRGTADATVAFKSVTLIAPLDETLTIDADDVKNALDGCAVLAYRWSSGEIRIGASAALE